MACQEVFLCYSIGMWRWIVGTSVITVAIAIVITWQAKRCETEREECQTAASTNPVANPMFPIAIRPNSDRNQEQPQDNASGACAHANSYLCLVLTTGNLPTIYLVLIGVGGIVVGIYTLQNISRQTDLLQKEFVVTHRPKLIIRIVWLEKGTVVGVLGQADKPWTVHYIIANTGGSRARVSGMSVNIIVFDHGLPPRYLFYRENPGSDDFFIEAGEQKPFSMALPDQMVAWLKTFNQSRHIFRDANFIYFTGCIPFYDNNGLMRFTGFCRHYEVEIGRFSVFADPDYEYSD